MKTDTVLLVLMPKVRSRVSDNKNNVNSEKEIKIKTQPCCWKHLWLTLTLVRTKESQSVGPEK